MISKHLLSTYKAFILDNGHRKAQQIGGFRFFFYAAHRFFMNCKQDLKSRVDYTARNGLFGWEKLIEEHFFITPVNVQYYFFQ